MADTAKPIIVYVCLTTAPWEEKASYDLRISNDAEEEGLFLARHSDPVALNVIGQALCTILRNGGANVTWQGW